MKYTTCAVAIMLSLSVRAQITTSPGGRPPATQAEVDAGLIHNKFVAPDTLAGYALAIGGATNGITSTQATNIVALNNAATATRATNADLSTLATTVVSNTIRVIRSNGSVTNFFSGANILGLAVSNATRGDIVELGAMYYSHTNVNIYVPDGVTIRGMGYNSHISSGNGGLFVLASDTTLENFRFDNTNTVRAGVSTFTGPIAFVDCTNVTLRNLWGRGTYDVTVSQGHTENINVLGCDFLFDYDEFNTAPELLGGVVTIEGSRLVGRGGIFSATGTTYFNGRALFLPGKESFILNSTIDVSNSTDAVVSPGDQASALLPLIPSNTVMHLIGSTVKAWNQRLLINYTENYITNNLFIYSPNWWGRVLISGTEFISNGSPVAVTYAVPVSDPPSAYITATNGYIVQLNQDATEFYATGAGSNSYDGHYVMESTNSGTGYAKFTNAANGAYYCELNLPQDLTDFTSFKPIYVFRHDASQYAYVKYEQTGFQKTGFVGFIPSDFNEAALPAPSVFFKTNSVQTNYMIVTYDARLVNTPSGSGTATNAIANNNGTGTNTTLYGTTSFVGTGDTNAIINAPGGGTINFTNPVTGVSARLMPDGNFVAQSFGIPTNAAPSHVVVIGERTFSTNATFTLTSISGIDMTTFNYGILHVHNTLGSLIQITPPDAWGPTKGSTNGVWNCTNDTIITVSVIPGDSTNAISYPQH